MDSDPNTYEQSFLVRHGSNSRSGALNGGFALPMKHSRSWKWENLWLVFSVVGIFVVPWALAFGLVPGLMQVYAGVTPRALLLPLGFGLLWGFAQVTFGVSLRMVGVALTMAVVSGLGSLSGSLVPLLVFHPEDLFRPRGLLLLLSIPFLIVGLIFLRIRRPQTGKGTGRPEFPRFISEK